MQSFSFNGGMLFLSIDLSIIARQIAGERVSVSDAGVLRDDISTDEITPLPSLVHYNDEIGRHAHTGFKGKACATVICDPFQKWRVHARYSVWPVTGSKGLRPVTDERCIEQTLLAVP
jgi:hypothetical protein